MKKFALIDEWGNWERKNGKTIIYCTVKGYKLIAEANERQALTAPPREYREDGTWHDFRVEKRAVARKLF